jgi:hypothetical protein
LSDYQRKQHASNADREKKIAARRMPAPIARYLRVAAMAGALAIIGVFRLQAQSDDASFEISREYSIKAAYLYQFCRYVQWPATAFADSRSPLVIGILGQSPFGDALEEIARTKRVEGRPIVIRQFMSMTEYKPCQILFVTASAGPAQTTAAIEMAKKAPVFLVGEEPSFIQQGGVANFFLEENRIRFEVNAEAAQHKQLKISSKLLSLAKIVREQP